MKKTKTYNQELVKLHEIIDSQVEQIHLFRQSFYLPANQTSKVSTQTWDSREKQESECRLCHSVVV